MDANRFQRILDEIATWPSTQISFDDGNASDAEIGLPALVQRGLSAHFFPIAGRLDMRGSLGPDEVRDLATHGMAVGTHGMSHRSWRHMDQATRAVELVDARRRLEEAAGCAVTEAACPMGQYDRRVLSDLRRLGYRRVYTSDRRRAQRGSWLQSRFSVRCHDTPESLRATVLNKPSLAWVRLDIAGLIKRLR